MIDGDPFVQWIVVPDDRPALPPVDEDICGLKDFSSLELSTNLHIDQRYNEPSGLLLADTFDPITLPYGAPLDTWQNVFHPSGSLSSHKSSYYASLFPPALSPDSSPTSVASSTPWLRTPETDPSLADDVNVEAGWDTAETKEEPCSILMHFLDQSGNSLEDIPSQVQDMMLEDIACTPQIICDVSLPPVLNPTASGNLGLATSTHLCNTPTLTEVPHGPPHFTSLSPSSPHILQSLFPFSPVACHPRETPLPEYSTSPSLSPLSNLSVFSQSPSVLPNQTPLVGCSSLSPAISPVSLSNSDERLEATDSVSSSFTRLTSVTFRGKRSAAALDGEAPPWKIPRRSKAQNIDEEEWNPGSARLRRLRAVASSKYTRQTSPSIPNCSLDETSRCETSQDSEGHSDVTHTSCEICGQGFTRMSDYVRHIENSASHPETRKVWPCPYCESTLGRKDALGRHVRTMHPGLPVIITEGIPGSRLHEDQKEPSAERMGQRKIRSMGQPRKKAGTRRYR